MATSSNTASLPSSQRESAHTDPHLAWAREAAELARQLREQPDRADLFERLCSLRDKIAQTPATTPAGIAEQVRLAVVCDQEGSTLEECEITAMEGALASLERLATQPEASPRPSAAVETARDDKETLARLDELHAKLGGYVATCATAGDLLRELGMAETRNAERSLDRATCAAEELLRQAKALVDELRRGAGTVLASAGVWVAMHALL